MPAVYILYSNQLDRFYIGATDGTVEDRLQKHLSNHSGFTAKAKDWVIKYTEEYQTTAEARLRESQIKAWKSRKRIQALFSQ